MIFNRVSQFVLIIFFFITLSIGMLGTIFAEKEEISELENRPLAEFPEISIEGFLDGSLSKSLNQYIGDHIILRELFIEKYTSLQLLLGRKEVNEVTIINKDLLLPKLRNETKISILEESVQSLLTFTYNSRSDVYMYFLPHKVYALENAYPKNYNYKFKSTLGRNQFLNILNELDPNFYIHDINKLWNERYSLDEKSKLYYNTDHHWNHEGVYQGYIDIISDLRNRVSFDLGEPYSKKELTFECFNDKEFLGSYHRKLYYLGDFSEESLCRYVVESVDNFIQYDENNKITNESYRNVFYRDIEDQNPIDYRWLFSYNNSLLKFTNNNAKNDEIALILKDSYSNPFVPFMVKHFNTLYIIDLRYFDYEIFGFDSLEDFIKKHDITTTLILYNDNMVSGPLYNFFNEETLE